MLSPKNVLRPLVLAALVVAAPQVATAQNTNTVDNGQEMARIQVPEAAIPTVNARTNALTEALANTHSSTALLRARLEEEKARAELEELLKARRASGVSQSTTTTSSSMGAGSVEITLDGEIVVEDAPAPYLLAIYGVDKKLYASVRYRNGLTQDIRVGEVIDGGFKVSRITATDVTLTRNGVTQVLSTFPGVNAVSSSGQGATGMQQTGAPGSMGAPRTSVNNYAAPAGAIRR